MKRRILASIMVMAMIWTSSPLQGLAEERQEVNVKAGGTTLAGEYVAVVNTNSDATKSQSTGTLHFDAGVGASVQSTSALSEEEGLYPEADVMLKETKETTSGLGRLRRAVAGYSINQEKTFYGGMTFVCIKEGTNSYVWMEKSLYTKYKNLNLVDTAGQEVADIYDGRPSKVIQELGGSAPEVYADNTGKLSILIEDTKGSSGYYAGEDGITAVHINAVPPDKYQKGSYLKYDGLMVHEMQHAMFRHLACNGDKTLAYELSWINEGLSVAAMDYYWGGEDPTGWLGMIDGNLNIRKGSALIYAAYRNSSAQDYAMPYLFVRYLADQKQKGYNPASMLKAFYNKGMKKKGQAIPYINSVLKDAGLKDGTNSLTFQKALTNFYVAAMAQENEGAYGFYGDETIRKKVTDYPLYAGESGTSTQLEGTAAIVLKTIDGSFTVPTDAGADIKFVAFNKTTTARMPKGSGTVADPYQIATPADMSAMSAASNANYKLMNDIDMSGQTVAFPAQNFAGVFDGNGKTLLRMTKPLVYVNKGTIKNVTVNGFSGEFRNWTGVISNFNEGTITDCRVTGMVSVRFTSTKMFERPAFGTMTGENDMSGVIKNCYSDATVTLDMPANTDYAGMIAGYNRYEISNCYAKGSMTVVGNSDATLMVGGIVGEQYSTITPKPWMENCYSTTNINVTGGKTKYIGQIAGSVQSSSGLERNYGISGISAVGEGKQAGAESKSQVELKKQETYTNWGFGSIWQMSVSDGLPEFYQPQNGDITATLSTAEYYVGEELQLYGATLRIGEKAVPLTADMLQTFDSTTPGEKTIAGTYRGVAFTLTATVKSPGTVSFLEVYTKPQMEYMEGQTFDATGTKLRATIDGKMNRYISSGYTVDKIQPLTVDDTEVTYNYQGTLAAKLPITVKGKASAVKQIQVIGAPRLSEYYVGDKLEIAGLKVQLIYNDGSKSELIEPSQFDSKNIHISKGMSSKISYDAVLTDKDNGTSIYVYYGPLLPEMGGSIYGEIGALEVHKNLWMENQTVRFAVNKNNYVSTEAIEGVTEGDNAGVTCSDITQQLPSGITAETPSARNNFKFDFQGTPTVEETKVIHCTIKDNISQKSIDVQIVLEVGPPSAACNVESFFAFSSDSSQKYKGLINHEDQTIVITLPTEQPIKHLRYEFVASEHADRSYNGWYNFATPLTVYAISEDGANRKEYTVTVIQRSSTEQLAAPEHLLWAEGVASWSTVDLATVYIVELMERKNIDNPSGFYDETITVVNTTDSSVDFSHLIGKKKHYLFQVTAIDATNEKLQRISQKSELYQYEEPVVRSVSITPAQQSLKVGTQADFQAKAEGFGGIDTSIIWYVSGARSLDTKVVGSIDEIGEQIGTLVVGLDEVAQEITIRAASAQDKNVYAEATIDIEQYTPLAEPTDIAWNGEVIEWIGQDPVNTKGYRLALMKDGTQVGEVIDLVETSTDLGELIRANGIGRYSVIVQAYGNGFLDSVPVESPLYTAEVTKIEINPTEMEALPGESYQFTSVLEVIGAVSQESIWNVKGQSSEHTTIDENGRLSIDTEERSEVLSVSVESQADRTKVATAKITVLFGEATSIKVSEENLYLNQGDSVTLKGTVLPTNAKDKALVWTSKDAAIATVNSNGVITAKTAGSTQVEATLANGITASCNITVSGGTPYLDEIYVHSGYDTPGALGTKDSPMSLEGALARIKNNGTLKIISASCNGYSDEPGDPTAPKEQFPAKDLVIEGVKSTNPISHFTVRYSLVANGNLTFRNLEFNTNGSGGDLKRLYLNGHDLTFDHVTVGGTESQKPTIIGGAPTATQVNTEGVQTIRLNSGSYNGIYAGGEGATNGNVHILVEEEANQSATTGSGNLPRGLFAGGINGGIVKGSVRIEVKGRHAQSNVAIDGLGAEYTSVIIDNALPVTKTNVRNIQELSLRNGTSLAHGAIAGLVNMSVDSASNWELLVPQTIAGTLSGAGTIQFGAANAKLHVVGEARGSFTALFRNGATAGDYINVQKGSTATFTYRHPVNSQPVMTGAALVNRMDGDRVIWGIETYARVWTTMELQGSNLGLNNTADLIGGKNQSWKNYQVGVVSKDQKGQLFFNPGNGATLENYETTTAYKNTFTAVEAGGWYTIWRDQNHRIPAGNMPMKVKLTSKEGVQMEASTSIRFVDTPEMKVVAAQTQVDVNAPVNINVSLLGAQGYSGMLSVHNEDQSETYATKQIQNSHAQDLSVRLSKPGTQNVYVSFVPTNKSYYRETTSGAIGIVVKEIEIPITKVMLNKAAITLNKGASETLTATLAPANTTDSKEIMWSSNATAIATVDNKGQVTAKASGNAVITVKTSNGKTESCSVKVLDPITGISLNKSAISMKQGAVEVLRGTITPTNTTSSKSISWSSNSIGVASVDNAGRVTAKKSGQATITARSSNGKVATCKVTVAKKIPGIQYRTHVENIGWQGWKVNGAMAGTTGKGLRLEGLNIQLNNSEYGGGIEYRSHVQNIGWQGFVKNGAMSGTSAKSLRVEAINLKLYGEIAQAYDVYYRVYTQGFGWLGWAKNGQSAGSATYGYRLEGMEIRLVPKGGKAPGTTVNPYRQQLVFYQTHIENIGWQKYMADGAMAGTTGRSLRLEGIRIYLPSTPYAGGVQYRTHIQNIGWEGGWKSNNTMSGTSGKAYRLEAIQIKLYGEMANKYDIYYRVHAQNLGWLGWAKNGQSAGTAGYSYRLEGILIQLVPKGSAAPGSTARPYVGK